ncbi:MAG: IS30 family transposase [Kiritimatiellae bacterium]|nr:IS30 family transposase [Kiritimatiellia bacterium]NKB25177.1 IS30 family transposase [Kiritimatiellia bacterium]
MEQIKSSIHPRKGKHLTQKERIMIETMLKNRGRPLEIASYLGRHRRTIEREIKRGEVEHFDTEPRKKKAYSSDRAQELHDLNATAKGPELKLGKHHETAVFISEHILVHKRSPDVVAPLLKQEQRPAAVSTKTLYTYIDQGLIPGVSNESLWEKRKRIKRKRRAIKRVKKQHARRTSIEKRPKTVEKREEFGHWELDLIVGGKGTSKPVLMTLVERKTRMLRVRKLSDKTQASVLQALKAIERSMGVGPFRSMFKSITADNGSEFLDVEQMERSGFSKKRHVKLYYAHLYSSWERGSNENANRMVCRFVAKGDNIGKYTIDRIGEIEKWINNYPRKILEYKPAQECFDLEIAA